jgi:hypothetical protein
MHLRDMGKTEMLNVGEKKIHVCAYKEQYAGVSQPNTAKYLSSLWGKCIHQSMLCLRYFQ